MAEMEITKTYLEEKYNSMTNDDLCKELGVSYPTLMRILRSSGIELKGSGNPWHRTKIRVIK